MSNGFLAQKGTATPAATHPGGVARFHACRTIVLPAINLHTVSKPVTTPGHPGPALPQPAARLTRTAAIEKRKFTFRIDPARHAAFCRAAESQNVSRQRLLTDALDDLLRRLEYRTDQAMSENTGVPQSSSQPGPLPLGRAAALPPSL